MTRRTWWIALGIVAALLLLIAIWWLNRSGDSLELGEDVVDPTGQALEALDGDIDPLIVDLYFPGEGGKLYAESRSLARQTDLAGQIQVVIQTLLEGPQSSSLRAPLGDQAQLRQVYLVGGTAAAAATTTPASTSDRPTLAGQTVVLDLATEGALPPRSTGSQRERLVAYSLVNSVLLNFEQGRGVIILWNGQQSVTFGGHIDTGRPLGADLSLVARQPPPPYDAKDDSPSLLPPAVRQPGSGSSGEPGDAESPQVP